MLASVILSGAINWNLLSRLRENLNSQKWRALQVAPPYLYPGVNQSHVQRQPFNIFYSSWSVFSKTEILSPRLIEFKAVLYVEKGWVESLERKKEEKRVVVYFKSLISIKKKKKIFQMSNILCFIMPKNDSNLNHFSSP